MKKIMSVLAVLVFLLSVSTAFANADLSTMTISELADLRDQINAEINSRERTDPLGVVEANSFRMTITGIEQADDQRIDELYDKYNTAYGTSGKNQYLLITYTIENKSDGIIRNYGLMEIASINGWVVNGYYGLRDILVPAKKKANGFVFFQIQDCDASSIDDIDSAEFRFTVIFTEDVWYSKKSGEEESVVIKITKTDTGYIVTSE